MYDLRAFPNDHPPGIIFTLLRLFFFSNAYYAEKLEKKLKYKSLEKESVELSIFYL